MSEPIMAEQQMKDVGQKNNSSPSQGQEMKSEPLEEKRKELFKLAMRDEWEEVIKIYKTYPEVQDQRLTRAKGTTLHVAISADKEDVALGLLAVVSKDNVKKILETKNDTQSTPLHVAASHGMHRACWNMAKCCPELVMTERNRHGETPLFTAVRHGKEDAFFALERWVQVVNKNVRRDVTHCRRTKDGNNILHFAILGEYFGLAIEISELYPELVNYVNYNGESPLHYLAKKPSCFKSGTRFGLYDQLIYSCIFIGQYERKFVKYINQKSHQPEKPKSDNQLLPETFNTFSQFSILLKTFLQIATKMREWIHIPKWIPKRCSKTLIDKSTCTPHGGDPESSQDNSESSQVTRMSEWIRIPKWNRRRCEKSDEENSTAKAPIDKLTCTPHEDDQEFYQEIYDVGVAIFKVVMKVILFIMGIGLWRTQELERKKRMNTYALQLMNELINNCRAWEYEKEIERSSDADKLPDAPPPVDNEYSATQDVTATTKDGKGKGEDGHQVNVFIKIYKYEQKEDKSTEAMKATPVLVAARNGITEMVEKILDTFPVAVLDVDENEKNIVLLAAEYRQIHIYKLMLNRDTMKDTVFRQIDKDGNNALYLTAKLNQIISWRVPGEALQMQFEIKWYKYVMKSLRHEFFNIQNYKGQTAQEVFTMEHKDLVKEASLWMFNTSQSCSLIAALIVGVAFTSATNVPGGTDQNSGLPILSGVVPFQIFVISSLVALCFSVASLFMFLTILTSRNYKQEDFERSLPLKLIFGFTSLFIAIVAMLISFCAGNFLEVKKELKYMAFAMYAIIFFPVSFSIVAQFPLYIKFLEATISSGIED
ncbi:uncharacterized protein [Typha latifolia]|uniref:uncharacterized protein isoform X2 n=1 Tax=Typha latifolia TaxID=4733 RepID=UPI003C30115B